MPLALARAADAHAATLAARLVGRSSLLDRAAALLARHLGKLHVVLLGLLFVGGSGVAGRRRREAALRIAAALPVTIGMVSVVGRLVERDRPFARHSDGTVLVDHAPGRSFPSRHSACAAAMTTVALPAAPMVGALMAIGTLGLAVSRVYTGLHYPSDVLGGWLIGVGIGIIARRKELPRVIRT
ncbi:MAG TPA: phosphatase PAP2 family protein [Chloroflexota bacterium]|nr:phosphatase PAP2 family protein [Chloroflexota bacterium]